MGVSGWEIAKMKHWSKRFLAKMMTEFLLKTGQGDGEG